MTTKQLIGGGVSQPRKIIEIHAVVQCPHVTDGLHRPIVTRTATAKTTMSPRIFPKAQVERFIPPVPYAWAGTNTISTNATSKRLGTGTQPWPQESKGISFCGETAPSCASTGSVTQDVPATVTTTDIYVLDAVKPHTELRTALELRRHNALTPYNPDAWERLLTEAGLWDHYKHIPEGLRRGFRIGFPTIKTTQTPPNSATILEHHDEFAKIISHELRTGRYLGPASRSELEKLIGPFQSSPFSIMPKPGRPDKYRNTQNFSFPYKPSIAYPNPSINSHINSDDFPTTWGTFALVSLLISRLPPNCEIATRDVAEAYRTVALHESQWPACVARLAEDSFAVDTATSFGAAPSAGTYGEVRNAGADIIRYQGIGPLSSWVDDHLFFRLLRDYLPEYNRRRQEWHFDISTRGRHQNGGRIWFGGKIFEDGTLEQFDEDCRFPCQDLSNSSPRSAADSRYTYNFDDIDRVSEELGIPWERSKDVPFGQSAKYIGFTWNMSTLQVSLGTEKKEKYHQAIQEWQARLSHTLKDVEKLYGKLLHTCAIIPSGRAFLTGLEAMLTICHDRPFVPHSANKGISGDLEWWVSVLQRPSLSRAIPGPVELYDIGAFSDASSGVGIGIVVQGRWRAWRLIPGWQTLDGQRDIAWAEAIGFECLVRLLCSTNETNRNFLIYGDNKGVVEGWWNGRSRNRAVNDVFKRIHSFLEINDSSNYFHTAYVPSKSNPADGPSRGIFPSPTHLLPSIYLPPCLDRFLVDAQLPYTPTEQRLHREGRYSKFIAKRINDANERDTASLCFRSNCLNENFATHHFDWDT
jgi:hypothetical protein